MPVLQITHLCGHKKKVMVRRKRENGRFVPIDLIAKRAELEATYCGRLCTRKHENPIDDGLKEAIVKSVAILGKEATLSTIRRSPLKQKLDLESMGLPSTKELARETNQIISTALELRRDALREYISGQVAGYILGSGDDVEELFEMTRKTLAKLRPRSEEAKTFMLGLLA